MTPGWLCNTFGMITGSHGMTIGWLCDRFGMNRVRPGMTTGWLLDTFGMTTGRHGMTTGWVSAVIKLYLCTVLILLAIKVILYLLKAGFSKFLTTSIILTKIAIKSTSEAVKWSWILKYILC